MTTENTHKTGRKRMTPEQLKEAKAVQLERVRITNLVARKSEIVKKCCICGKLNAPILHNPNNLDNPYMITFLCWNCRKDPDKLQKAEEYRFDIREKLNKSNLNTRNITDEETVKIINGYMKEMLSIVEYCEKIGISRHQFNKLLDRYEELIPDQPIRDLVFNKSKALRTAKLSKIYYETHLD